MTARWLGPSGRGVLAIMIELAGISLAVVSFGLTYAALYFASRRDADRGAVLGNSLAFGAGLALVFVPLFWWLRGPISQALAHGRGGATWALAGGLIAAMFLDFATHNQLYARLRFGLLNLLRVLSRLAVLLLSVLLVGALGLGVEGAMIATLSGSAVIVAGSVWIASRDARPRLDLALFRRMLGYGGRVQLGWMFQVGNARLDILILQFFVPLASVGHYFIAEVVAELVLVVGIAFQGSVLPLVTRFEGDARQEETTVTALRHHGILSLVAVLGNAAFGTVVILFAFGPAFRAALLPMLIILPGMWFQGTGGVVAGALRGRGKPGASSAVAGIALAVTIGLDLALIPPFGLVGAAIASLVTYTVFGTLSLVVLSRVAEIPLRRLIVPTRADFAAYPRALKRRGKPAPTAPG